MNIAESSREVGYGEDQNNSSSSQQSINNSHSNASSFRQILSDPPFTEGYVQLSSVPCV